MFSIRLRIPGWATSRPVPSDLYSYMTPTQREPQLSVNGKPVQLEMEKGYAVLTRTWKTGDEIDLQLPMSIHRVTAHELVAANRGRVAIERGPLVYCVEGTDHDGHALNLILPDNADLRAERRDALLGGITVIRGSGLAAARSESGELTTNLIELTFIPYYAWCHRDVGPMAVWLARQAEQAEVAPSPTLASESRASASHCFANDTVDAMNDQVLPQNSIDHSIPRFTWWDHRGSTEWVQYDLKRPTVLTGVEVYWFDDTGRGACRIPKSWRVQVRAGEEWVNVKTKGEFSVEKDRFNQVTFEPVTTTAVRIEVDLQPDFSGGILEWKLIGG
jgi:hypothetical protein